MTDTEVLARIDTLRASVCDYGLIEVLHGLRLGDHPVLIEVFHNWLRFNGKEKYLQSEGRIHRFAFETFLQSANLLSAGDAALRLGMRLPDLWKVIAALRGRGNPLSGYDDEKGVVAKAALEGFHRVFPSLQRKTFLDQQGYCQAIHGAIRTDLDLNIDPVLCETSQFLAEQPPARCGLLIATERDCLSDGCTSTKYSVWLDLGKPLNLAPDRTSAVTALRHLPVLERVDRCFYNDPREGLAPEERAAMEAVPR